MTGGINDVKLVPQMPLEDFEREARKRMNYMSEDRQITALVHLIYHTLASGDEQENFIFNLDLMRALDQH
jgi:hypothetical protein